MQNMLRREVVLPYSTARQDIDLTAQRALHAIRLQIAAHVVIAAGGGADGTLVQDGVIRLIRQIRASHDDEDIVEPMPLVPLYYFHKRSSSQPVAAVNLSAPGINAGEDVSAEVLIPFSWKAFANPYDVYYFARQVQRQFKLYIDWETGVATAGDTPGSAALVTGGSRAITLSSVQVTVTEITSAAQGKFPQLFPKFRLGSTEQFTVAQKALPFKLLTGDRIAAHLLMEREGSLEERPVATKFNAVTLRAANTRKVDNVSYASLKSEEVEDFPGVATTETSTVLLNMCNNGKFGTALDPIAMGSDPRYEFDVPAPTTAPGIIKVLELALWGRPGDTVLQR